MSPPAGRGGRKPPPPPPFGKAPPRQSVLQLARERNVSVIEERFTRDAMYVADEAFPTGTAAEITPVREIDGRRIGTGTPGPVTKDLQKTFFEIVRGEDRAHSAWLTRV